MRMNEANPYIERFQAMNPKELDQQFNGLKLLLPNTSLLTDIERQRSLPVPDIIKQVQKLVDHREGTEINIRGKLMLNALKPRMLITDFMKNTISELFALEQRFGLNPDDHTKHMLEVMFQGFNDELVVPDNVHLHGGLFIPHQSATVEMAVLRWQLVNDEAERELFKNALGNRPRPENDATLKQGYEWMRQVRELHGIEVF